MLLYRMLDIPRSTGSYLFSSRQMTQIQDAGKDIEDRLVMKWHDAGYLLSPPPFDPYGRRQNQMVFEDADHWLTSTVDAIVLWPRRIQPIVCEVKSKYADVIDDMRNLLRGPDEKHVKQLKTQIGLAKEHYEKNPTTVRRCFNSGRLAIPMLIPRHEGEELATVVELRCPQHRTTDCLEEQTLIPPSYGYIYYVSRDNPVDTFTFYFEHDERHMELGRQRLKEFRQAFINNTLPQTNFKDKRYAHPFGWLWGDQPCKWCDYGDHCRSDTKAAIARGGPIALHESDSVDFAKGIRDGYDFDLVRAAVGRRWGLDDRAMIPSSAESTGEESTERKEAA